VHLFINAVGHFHSASGRVYRLLISISGHKTSVVRRMGFIWLRKMVKIRGVKHCTVNRRRANTLNGRKNKVQKIFLKRFNAIIICRRWVIGVCRTKAAQVDTSHAHVSEESKRTINNFTLVRGRTRFPVCYWVLCQGSFIH